MIYAFGILFFLCINSALSFLENKNELVVIITIIIAAAVASNFFSLYFACFCLGMWMANFLGKPKDLKDIVGASALRRKYGIIFTMLGALVAIGSVVLYAGALIF